jgi:uncharacterized protein
MKVVITGGSGLIGSALARNLYIKGHEIGILGRNTKNELNLPYHFYKWDIDKSEIDRAALENTDYIVHLAGENISDKRWTIKQKLIIEKSRVKSAELVFDYCKENITKLKAFITSSAIGYYGTFTSGRILYENDSPGNDFLAEIGVKWENAADLFKMLGIRTVKIRTGVVLSHLGAAYTKMSKPIKLGMGASFGNGKQYVPWIHLDDIVAIFEKAIEDEKMDGAYNGVSPCYLTNKELTQAIAKSLNKPYWLPNIPSFVIRAVFGEMSDILLKGTRISADKIVDQGFQFKFPTIEIALEDLAKQLKKI